MDLMPRPTAAQRGYGAKWRAEALRFLIAHPVCCVRGCGQRATRVDHAVPHRGDEVRFWTRSNWQPMCESHHNAKSAKEGAPMKRGACDRHGVPLARSHHWHR
jgi:5-methylcytosine-specific restriction enzyme A